MLKLYDYFRSSAAFRVRIALNLKELSYEAIPIHLLNQGGEQYFSEYQAINPQSLVPSLTHNDQVITQSLAILEYLEEVYPAPPLLPKNALHRAWVRAFSLAIIADLHPLNNLRVLKYLSEEMGVTNEQKNQWYQHWMKVGLTALEKLAMSSPQKGDFCLGDTPTFADICLVPQLFNARRFQCDLSSYPNLVRIDANCQALFPFAEAKPKEIA